ncbi:MAG: hypothetical protein OEZ38_05555 [Gammaproteobacteria bacterium]|nr:hypothetical protein [Gammaproteobacteria bacterium]
MSIILTCLYSFSTPAFAFENSELESLKGISKVLAAKRLELVQIKNKRDALEDRLKREEGTLQLLESNENQKKQEYRKLLTIVSNNPDIDLGDKVNEKKELYNTQKKLVDEQQDMIRAIENNIAIYNNKYREMSSQIEPIERNYSGQKKAIVNKELQTRIESIQISRDVTATGKYTCTEINLSTCRERARKNAEQSAVEQGSSVFVNSMTEVKNFQLSKEVVRSEVGATLSNIKEVEKGWKGDDTWAVTITATVTPSLSGKIRNDMYATVENDLNTRLALNSPIGTMGGGYTPPPTPGLVKEDYPKSPSDSRIGRDSQNKDSDINKDSVDARALAAQKAAEAAAAEAAAREAEATAREKAARNNEENTQKNNDNTTPTKGVRRLNIGF